MSTREQLINDIKQLPDHTVQAISVIVREIVAPKSMTETLPRPIFGSGKGQMWISDDFDAPLEELKEYMQ
jgi:hypothetical protein